MNTKKKTTKTSRTSKKRITRSSLGLRNCLFDELDGLVEGTTSPAKANAVARVAAQIVSSARLDLDFAHKASKSKAQITGSDIKLGS